MSDYVRSRPRHYASGAGMRTGAVGRRYQQWYSDRHLRRFFEVLLEAGELVFDVGANEGDWTRPLRRLGCRVVAVEPQAEFASAILERHREDPAVHVVAAAIGESAGETDLYRARHGAYASVAPEWMTRMIERGGIAPDFWERSERVPVRTLDDLIDEFGLPDYVKLDVEGSEPAALRGLTHPVNLLSFESHGQTFLDARACIERLTELGDYEFNLSPGEFPELEWHEWRDPRGVMRALEALPFGWNNVFARLRARRANGS